MCKSSILQINGINICLFVVETGHQSLDPPLDPTIFCLHLELTLCAIALHTQIPLCESWSPRSADTPESTGKTTTSA